MSIIPFPVMCTGRFTMNDTKTLSNNFYSIALYELTGVPYFHIYTDILIYRFLKLQQVSYNFPVVWNFYAQILKYAKYIENKGINKCQYCFANTSAAKAPFFMKFHT